MISSALPKRNAPALPPDHVQHDDRAAAAHLALGQIVLRMVLAPRVEHAGDGALFGEEIGDRFRVAHLLGDAQGQRLQPFQHDPGIERRHGRAGLAQEIVDVLLDELLRAQNARRPGTRPCPSTCLVAE